MSKTGVRRQASLLAVCFQAVKGRRAERRARARSSLWVTVSTPYRRSAQRFSGSLRRVALLTPYRSAPGGRAVLATRAPDRASIPLAPDVRLVIRPRALATFSWPPGTGPPLLHIPPPDHARPLRLPCDGTDRLSHGFPLRRVQDAAGEAMVWENSGLEDFAARVGGGFAAQQFPFRHPGSERSETPGPSGARERDPAGAPLFTTACLNRSPSAPLGPGVRCAPPG